MQHVHRNPHGTSMDNGDLAMKSTSTTSHKSQATFYFRAFQQDVWPSKSNENKTATSVLVFGHWSFHPGLHWNMPQWQVSILSCIPYQYKDNLPLEVRPKEFFFFRVFGPGLEGLWYTPSIHPGVPAQGLCSSTVKLRCSANQGSSCLFRGNMGEC